MTRRSTHILRGALGAAVIIAMAAGPATAQPLDTAAIKCRSAIAKAYSKLISTAGKTIGSCHKSRDTGKIANTVDCNTISIDSDAKGKVAKAQTKLTDAVAKSCTGVTSLLDNGHYYVSCPEPCATSESLSNPLASMTEVGKCLACMGPGFAETAAAAALGMPTVPFPMATAKADGKCHGAIAKGYQKYMDTLIKGRISCQGTEDGLGNYITTTDNCIAADPKDKGATALGKADDGLDKSCADAALAGLDSCDTTIVGIKSCATSAYGGGADEAFPTTYTLQASICPTSVGTLIRAGRSIDGTTNSSLSVGWTGLGHLIDLPDHYSISSAVTCPGTEAGTCGDCAIDGISAADPQYSDFLRCKADPSIHCHTPFVNNAECPSGGLCSYFLGAPLSVSAGGSFTCTLNALASDVSGTANPDNGSSVLNLDLRAVVYLGESQVQPCPLCIGDPTPQDGVKGGTCLGGANGSSNPGGAQACDVQAYDLSYATDTSSDGVSLDCPPAGGAANISGSGLVIQLPLSTGASSLPFANACDAPNGASSCACGVCSGNTALPCVNNAACALASAGTCTSFGSGQKREPNACAGYTCDDIGNTDLGECGLATPLDKFCSGFVRANGRGVLSCNTNADCATLNSSCPGGSCGTCTKNQLRSCFLNPIAVTGAPSTSNPVLAGTFCLPPTSNTAVNGAAGSPGPGEVKVDALVTLGY